MKKTLKRLLALVLVLCSLLSYTVPTANAAFSDWLEGFLGGLTGGSSNSNTGSDEETTDVTYNFVQTGEGYNKIPDDPGGKSNPIAYTFLGGDYLASCTQKKSIPERYAAGTLNWTYEAATEGACGTTTELEHVPLTSGNRYADGGIRTTMGQGQWIAFRIKSPGAGAHTVKLTYRKLEGAPTVAVYIMEAEGTAVADLNTTEGHNTVLDRRETIHAAMDPDNRVGKVDQNVGTTGTDLTNFIGNYTFEANKEYIVVFENYETAAIPGNYWSLHKLVLTPGATSGTETKGEAEVKHILVQNNVVPAADGGYMTALVEVKGHDYYFLPLEGGKMAIFDLDKHIAGEASLVKMVTTGLYYPTHATVTDDGRVIIGGDGKKLFIFDTKTMTGRNTPDFRSFAGLNGEGHNQGSHYGSDGYLYLGTLYGGHAVQYDIDARTYVDLGDLVTASVRAMAGITANPEEETGAVRATYYHEGFLYAKADSDNYTLIVKVDVAQRKPVAAINVTEQLHGSGVPHGITVLGDKYVIAGGSGSNGMVLIDLATFTLVEYDDVVKKGLFSSKSTAAQDAWENGMSGHASEVINGKQYFYISNVGMYSYDVATGKMAKENSNARALRTGQKASVTLDRNKDGVEETYVLTFASSGLRLFNVDTKASAVVSGLEIDMSAVGGSSINIGDSLDGVLYIGAWNNWNCEAFDTNTESILSRYVTGGQTDSQVSYVDENGQFHLVSGNYSACVVYEIDPLNKTGYGGDADSNIIKPLISNMKNYDQKRIHTVEYGDGYVFAGTIPGSYVNGGGVGTYNTATGKENFIHFKKTATAGETCVPAEFSELWDLAVKGIVYSDGRLYGATTRSGGSGAGVVEGTSAQVFVMDYKNNAIEATLDLRDYLTLVDADGDGVEDPINYVGGISADPVVPGRIWGIVSDVLFCFEYNKNTKTFNVQEVLNLGHKEYQSSGGVGQHNRKVIFNPEKNQLFVSFFNAEMQQIQIQNWNAAIGSIQVASNEMILNASPETYALGADNNLYYASGTGLYMKPVNVTADDWTAAQAVDAKINALGKVTADSMDDVVAARNAYDALTLRDKALVQEYRALQEAEAQVLDLQIQAEITNVTADSSDALAELIERYGDLAASQQRYVQSYEPLLEAYQTSIDLAYYAAAYAVQAQIDALPETITLADEAAVTAAREAYTILYADQQAVVDTARLVDAEATIIALKTAVSDVQTAINALPETITLAEEGQVAGLRAAYDALSDEQKALIDAAKLTAAEAQIAAMKSVQKQIDALPEEVTLANESAVKAARKAYNALTDVQKANINAAKLVAAENKIAELKAVQAVQTKIDALPEEVTLADKYTIVEARNAYEALTDAAKAQVDTAKLIAAEAMLKAIKTEAPTKLFYDFELYKNPDFIEDCETMTCDEATGRIKADFAAHRYYLGTSTTSGTHTIVDWFKANFTDTVNWAIETSNGPNTNHDKDYMFRGTNAQGMRMYGSTAGQYCSLRIFVPAAGKYTIDLKAGNLGSTFDIYIFEAVSKYTTARTSVATIQANAIAENQLVDNYTISAEQTASFGQWNFAEPGEYIVVFKAEAAHSNGMIVRNMTLTPEVVATVGEENCYSLEQAFAYQIENGAECVSLYKDMQVADLVLPSGAVLDLNGKKLAVDSVLSYASSGIIDNSEKDTGVLVINDADGNMLSADNAQLPIFDEAAGGYRFFEVDVKAVAITGKNSADPKYWFQVNVVNFEEVYKLIQAGSKLDIAVKMTWNGGEAEAVAGVDFLNTWAEKYAASDSFYITVSAVNTEGLEDFSLIPCMTANGVAICGSEM